MRDYGIVSPRFWIGETGRRLRAHPYAQRVAMYLLTAPSSDMTGVFYCPVATILNDVGSPSEGVGRGFEGGMKEARRALEILQSLGFCFYDFNSEFVFVKEMARWQIAESLKPTDNRVKSIRKTVDSMDEPMKTRFLARYNEKFSLGFEGNFVVKAGDVAKAPLKPLLSQEQEQEQKQEIKKEVEKEKPKQPANRRKPKTPWHDYESIPDAWREIVERLAPDLDPAKVFEDFRNYAIAQDARYVDWTAAFRNSVGSMPDWKRKSMSRTKGVPQEDFYQPAADAQDNGWGF